MSTSMSSSVLKITHISSSTNVQDSNLRPVIRKTCRPSGSLSHTALMQLVHRQKDYTPSGKGVYFCDFNVLSYL